MSTKRTAPKDYPFTPPAYTGLPAKRPATKVLTDFAQKTIKDFSIDGKLTIDTRAVPPLRKQGELGTMSVDEVDQVEPGTVIVSPPTDKAPYGVLRKVDSITENPDGTATVETSPATLAEAIAGSDLKPEDIQQTSYTVPVNVSVLAVPKAGAPQNLTLPDYLTPESAQQLAPQWDFFPVDGGRCETPPPAAMPLGIVNRSACIQLKLWMTVNVDIGWWFIFPYLKGFGAWANGWARVETSIAYNVQAPGLSQTVNLPGVSQTFLDTTGGVGVFWIGPIPVVVTPKVILQGGLSGTLSIQGNAGVAVSSSIPNVSFNLGTEQSPVQYGFYCGNTVANGYWGCKPVNNVAEKVEALRQQFTAWNPYSNPLALSGTASITTTLRYRANLSVQAGVYLYGTVGLAAALEPYAGPKITAGVEYNIQDPNQPVTRLRAGIYGGLDGRVMAGVNILGVSLSGDVIPQGAIVPETPLLPEFSRCWRGVGLTPCP